MNGILPILSRAALVLAAISPLSAFAQQTSTQLVLKTIQLNGPQPVELTFSDEGSGSTAYAVQFSPQAEGPGWTNVAAATVTDLGAGRFRATLPAAESTAGFYRILGSGGTVGSVVASFASTAFQVSEGGEVSVTLRFSSAFTGTIRYGVSGSAAADDFEPLSGQVTVVNSTSATIPVSLKDNAEIGALRQLVLRLESSDGVSLAANADTTITIEDNDADWRGALEVNNAALGFILRMSRSNAVLTAAIRGDGGIFPTAESAAAVVFGSDTFQCEAGTAGIAADASALNGAANLLLRLEAMNGVEGQSVSEREVSGKATLVTLFPGKPFLNTTNVGTFSLGRPADGPPDDVVPLTTRN